jgi:hypothetical protein
VIEILIIAYIKTWDSPKELFEEIGQAVSLEEQKLD